MATIAQDSFTGTDGVYLENHTPETGGSWAKYIASTTGRLQLLSNEVKSQRVTGTAYWYYRLGSGTDGDAIHRWTQHVYGDDDYGGAFFRGKDSNNFYIVKSQGFGTTYLYRRTAGTETLVTNANGGGVSEFDKVRVEVTGSSPTAVKVRIWDGTGAEPGTWNINTTENTAGNQTAAGAFGILARASSLTSWYGDDYSVETIVSGMTGTGATAFGYSAAGTAVEAFTGTGATAFAHAAGGTGAEAFTGTAATAFGFALGGAGSALNGVGATAYGWSSAAEGIEVVTGTGATAFGWLGASTGAVVVDESSTGTGATAFTFAQAGTGGEGFAGTAATAYGWATEAEGVVPVAGLGATAFGFAAAGTGSLGYRATGATAFGFAASGLAVDEYVAAGATAFGWATGGRAYTWVGTGGLLQTTFGFGAVGAGKSIHPRDALAEEYVLRMFGMKRVWHPPTAKPL